MGLTRNPEHEYPAQPDPKGWYRCQRCGKPTRNPAADTSWCTGLQQTRLTGGGEAHGDDPAVYGPYHAWVGTLDCLLRKHPGHRCGGRVTGHHLRSVGAGGTDVGNEVPLCGRAHREVHRIGQRSFATRYGLDLRGEARTLRNRAPPRARPTHKDDVEAQQGTEA